MSVVGKASQAVEPDLLSLCCEHVLHVFPSLGVGGVPLRMVRIINHFGTRFRHTVVALDNNFEAAAGIDGSLDVALWPVQQPRRGMFRSVTGGVVALRRFRPDLLLTYNWGAIEWAMAARLSPVRRHIHFEAGFSQREADSQIPRRVWFRRLALARCALVVVPSPTRGFGISGLAVPRRTCGIYPKRRRPGAFLYASARRHPRLHSAAWRTGDRHCGSAAPGKEYRTAPPRVRNARKPSSVTPRRCR